MKSKVFPEKKHQAKEAWKNVGLKNLSAA